MPDGFQFDSDQCVYKANQIKSKHKDVKYPCRQEGGSIYQTTLIPYIGMSNILVVNVNLKQQQGVVY